MIKVYYPTDKKKIAELEDSYWKIFKNQETEFNRVKRALAGNLKDFFKKINYKQIVLGDINSLGQIYNKYVISLTDNERKEVKDKFENIFSYNQSDISKFFEDHNHIFNLKACHYCNMDSVHVYSILGEYDNALDFIRLASKDDLINIIGLDENMAERIIQIPDRANLSLDNFTDEVKTALKNLEGTNIWSAYSSPLDFINNASHDDLKRIPQIADKRAAKIISDKVEPYSSGTLIQYPEAKDAYDMLCDIIKNGVNKNHFTLDHYIPQSLCCLFARSLYNFVPSCYVCNSKLKKEELLSNQNTELHTCCPTHDKYDSTGNLQFSLVQRSAVHIFDYSKRDEREQFLKNFEIEIESPNTNSRIVPVLHLKQRYSLYKDKAVKLAYLKEKYSEQSLAEIAKILSQGNKRFVTAEDIENDIFNDPLYENESFSKLHRDIKEQVGIKTR